jgi:ABC-type amino acid transport substrate-binding protein
MVVRIKAVALALVMAAAAVACGGNGGSSETSGSATAPSETGAQSGAFSPPPILSSIPDSVSSACSVSSPTIDKIKEGGTLNWAIGVSPPFGFKLPSGEWAGVEAQNAAELAKILGVGFKITDYSYDVLPSTLTTGQADIIGAQLFVTDERKQVIDFSEPYYKSGQLFYVLKDSPYQTIDDLNKPDIRFVYGTGGAQIDLAKKYVPNAKISDAPLRGQLLLYDFLAAHQADATMTEAAPMKVIFQKFNNPPLAAIGLNGRVMGERPSDDEMLDPFDVAFGLPKGDASWKSCVDAWVSDLLESGRMNERLDYWLAQSVA